MAKDFRNIEYHISPDGDGNGVRYYACSILNTKQKELIFNKNKGAIVQIRWEVNLGKDIKNLSETFNRNVSDHIYDAARSYAPPMPPITFLNCDFDG